MHKAILILLMVISSKSITAYESNWFEVGKSRGESQGDYFVITSYVDLSTIRIEGNRRKIWTLLNTDKPIGRIRSSKSLIEFDCKEEKARTIYSVAYYGNMGSGESKVMPSSKEEEFIPILPRSLNSKEFQITCNETQ